MSDENVVKDPFSDREYTQQDIDDWREKMRLERTHQYDTIDEFIDRCKKYWLLVDIAEPHGEHSCIAPISGSGYGAELIAIIRDLQRQLKG